MGRERRVAWHCPLPLWALKPVELVADAIRDCSRRRQIILDPFAGAGTTLIAAEKTGRQARVLELDPLYCDTIIRRWQKLTGKYAEHADTGLKFEDMEEQRLAEIRPTTGGANG